MVGSAISTGANSMVTMLVGRGIAGIGAAGLQAVSDMAIALCPVIDRQLSRSWSGSL